MDWWETNNYNEVRSITGDAIVEESKSDGVFEITLSSWRLIDAVLYTMNDMSHAIYRGVQKKNFRLEPSMFRGVGFKNMETIEERNNYITTCFHHFKEAVRGRRGPLAKPVEFYNNYELWSLGRHFGVRNTMLDWSHSPYVCLFFAFSNWHEEGIRALYCLKKNIIERFRKPTSKSNDFEKATIILDESKDLTLSPNPGYDQLRFYKPLSDDNFRMIHQQGLFTVSRSPNTIEEWVVQNYGEIKRRLQDALHGEKIPKRTKKLTTEIQSDWILLKINIHNDQRDRRNILKRLNRMNINYATLFPDIEGASLYANMQGDIHHY